jgi:hypothetical protein
VAASGSGGGGEPGEDERQLRAGWPAHLAKQAAGVLDKLLLRVLPLPGGQQVLVRPTTCSSGGSGGQRNSAASTAGCRLALLGQREAIAATGGKRR